MIHHFVIPSPAVSITIYVFEEFYHHNFFTLSCDVIHFDCCTLQPVLMFLEDLQTCLVCVRDQQVKVHVLDLHV